MACWVQGFMEARLVAAQCRDGIEGLRLGGKFSFCLMA